MSAFIKSIWVFLFLALQACGPSAPEPRRSVTPVLVQNVPDEPNEQAPVTEPEDEKITVALLLPLSGSEEATGRALLKAATLALFDAYDPRITVLPLDTAGTPLGAESAAQKAVEAQASIALGPLLAGNVVVAGEVLQEHGIPLLGFSNDRSIAAPGRYIMGFTPESEIKRVIDYVSIDGARRFAALTPVGRYGERVRAAFGDSVSANGAEVATIESYEPDPELMFDPVRRMANYDRRKKEREDEIRYLKSLRDDLTDEIAGKLERAEILEPVDFDAVLIPEGGDLLRALAPLLPFYEVDPAKVRFIGTGLWNDVANLREPPLQGGLFAAPPPEAPEAFLRRYVETYGEEAPRIATLAYDGMALVAVLARQEPGVTDGGLPESRFSADRIARHTGFAGVDGLFRFLPDGTVERMLAVIEVHRRGFRVIDPAPEAFPSFGYALKQ